MTECTPRAHWIRAVWEKADVCALALHKSSVVLFSLIPLFFTPLVSIMEHQ